jgi:predicted short-subunit dehydrogenase-like oxidoreductase (DUF2520 family)
MNAKPSVTIIGAGSVGSAWLDYFQSAGYPIRSAFQSDSGTYICPDTGRKENITGNLPADDRQTGDWLLLTTPDDLIRPIAEKLSQTGIQWSGRIVIHCSGSHDTSLLDSLKRKGALTLSVHPIQTFKKGDGLSRLQQISISLEGNPEAVNHFIQIAESLNSRPVVLTGKQKRTVHIAAVFASNYLVALLKTADSLLTEDGIGDGVELLKPLVRQTTENIFNKGLDSSLTGPVMRGDSTTVQNHLRQLEGNEKASQLYRLLGSTCLEMAKSRGDLNTAQITILNELLNA